MIGRITHEEAIQTPHPVKKFLEWKSNLKTFTFYDKEKGEDVEVALPFKFLFLQHYAKIDGYNEATNGGIGSNEVYNTTTETLTVFAFKGGIIAEGLYQDIKTKVEAAGGKYHRSIYVMLEDGSVSNISVRGSAVSEWSKFMDLNKNLVDNQWITVAKAMPMKKGSVSYTVPVFSIGDNITKAEVVKADEAANLIGSYLTSKFAARQEVIETVMAEGVDVDAF